MRYVPSTLHRLIKFNHDGNEYVVEEVEENPNIIIQVKNDIVPYTNGEIHEENDEESEEDKEDIDIMQMYKEIGVETYSIS